MPKLHHIFSILAGALLMACSSGSTELVPSMDPDQAAEEATAGDSNYDSWTMDGLHDLQNLHDIADADPTPDSNADGNPQDTDAGIGDTQDSSSDTADIQDANDSEDNSAAPYCGDEKCQAGETPTNCQPDCGYCGDSICSDAETPESCPKDCSDSCGDGVCAADENSESCLDDCPVCGDGVCGPAEGPAYCPQDCDGFCGDALCSSGESPLTCPVDCPDTCGDGQCGANESTLTCPADCVGSCGDGTCANYETPTGCPLDCGPCGDSVCGTHESIASCPKDCLTGCGDGLCAPEENALDCPLDCGPCGDGICGFHESSQACPKDCSPECGNGFCDADESCFSCPLDCQVCCGNGQCDIQFGESCANCTTDCGFCNGTPCDSPLQCSSGFCTDGLCCSSACDGTCQSCSTPQAPGLCAPYPKATDPEGECNLCHACSGGGACAPVEAGSDPMDHCTTNPTSTCSFDGTCNGAGQCRLWGSATVCKAAECSDATLSYARFCDGNGTCLPAAVNPCSPYTCQSTTSCHTNCNSDDDIASPDFLCKHGFPSGSAQQCLPNDQCGNSAWCCGANSCGDALTIPTLESWTAKSSTFGADDSFSALPTPDWGQGSPDRLFLFDVPPGEIGLYADITVANLTPSFAPLLYLRKSSASIPCATGASQNDQQLTTNSGCNPGQSGACLKKAPLEPGARYWMVVDGAAETSGDFLLALTLASPIDDCICDPAVGEQKLNAATDCAGDPTIRSSLCQNYSHIKLSGKAPDYSQCSTDGALAFCRTWTASIDLANFTDDILPAGLTSSGNDAIFMIEIATDSNIACVATMNQWPASYPGKLAIELRRADPPPDNCPGSTLVASASGSPSAQIGRDEQTKIGERLMLNAGTYFLIIDTDQPLIADSALLSIKIKASPRQNGEACLPEQAATCEDGFCADSVCCNNACSGTCRACNTQAKPGICTNFLANTDPEGECGLCSACNGSGACSKVAAGSDPLNQCTAQSQSTCGTDGSCNGQGACRLWSSTTPCAQAKCAQGIYTPQSYCNGSGTCVTPPTVQCGPYTCNTEGTACRTSCTQDSDCAQGFGCSATGTCAQ